MTMFYRLVCENDCILICDERMHLIAQIYLRSLRVSTV